MAIKRNRKGRKGPVQAKKVICDGITFASGLERYTYRALKKAKLFEGYENEKFQVMHPFSLSIECYEKQANGKGDFTQRGGKKILGISYTPDFCGKDFIIECKGRANPSFPIRWKLFKKHQTEVGDQRALYKPQNQKDVDLMITIIKQRRQDGIAKGVSREVRARETQRTKSKKQDKI